MQRIEFFWGDMNMRKIYGLQKLILVSCLFSLMMLCVPRTLLGQGVTAGSIQGTITDTSGAVIPGATVTITNVGTNVRHTVTTHSSGDYAVGNLAVARYQVRVAMPGFSTQVRSAVDVSVGHTTVLDIELAPGQASETVTVEAHAVDVTLDRGDRSTQIAAETLQQLPLQVSSAPRQTDSFITLAPGVTGDTFAARINGAPNFSQDFYYDGIPYMNADGGGRQEQGGPPVDAVDEFAINTNAYSAQYGRGSGLLNFHLHSGANRLHGGAWEYLRNNKFDASGYYGGKTNSQKQHEFGAKLSGPVYIPKLYDGRDKTFFSVVFDWYKFRGGVSSSLITLPTAKMLTGDFSELPFKIYDPATTVSDGAGGLVRQEFPGNIIPASRKSVLSSPYLDLMPTATRPGITDNAVAIPGKNTINNFYPFVKIDHSITPRFILHGSYYQIKKPGITSPVIPGPLGAGNNFESVFYEPRFSLDQNFSANIYNQTLYSIQYTSGTRAWYPLVPQGFSSPLATAGLPYPAISIAGMPTFGAGQDNNQTSGGCQPCAFFADNFKWQKGRHALSFGTEIRWEDESDAFARNIGTYSFGSAATTQPNAPNRGALGYGFASFYLGTLSNASMTGGAAVRLVKTGYRAFYAQDDIKVTPKLTVNVGMRWDYSIPVTDPNNGFSTFDPTVPNPGAGGRLGSIVFTGKNGGACIPDGGASLCKSQMADTYYNMWQPRFGFAYRWHEGTVIRGGIGKSSLRGGASTLMGPMIAAGYLTGFQYQNTMSSQDAGITPPVQLRPTWDVGVPSVVDPPVRDRTLANGQSLDYMQPIDGKNGYVTTWSLTVEQELPYKMVLESSYVGSSGVRLGSNLLNANQTPAKYLSLGSVLSKDINSPEAVAAGIELPYPGFQGTVAQALRPYPQYNAINEKVQTPGHSSYHSLQERLQKGYSNGMTLLVTYTWSKTITDSLSQFSGFGAYPQDTAQRRRERQVLGANADGAGGAHVLNIASTYELPIGPGKKFLNQSPILGRVLGGWGASGVLTYSQAAPLPIGGGTPNPIFNGSTRPNIVPGVNQKLYKGGKFNPYTDRYVNPTAFSDAGAFALGNAPPTLPQLHGFMFANESLSLLKNTKIRDTANLELRIDAFDAFNRVVFGRPNMDFSQVSCGTTPSENGACNGAFGKVNSQANAPRQVQFGVRLSF
ncbi:MAG: hypothetical protein BGO25_03795 [Acidobacteriales bacterium 59-55]|nr:MAG: hypothetical protein BGO25_03795 [Acidobacteriales bacterium 59-55]